jgi:hypothetical protein
MGYHLRMHSEIRDWLTDLRNTEPELGRLVGEAVVALLDAGESLGPPLVVPLESVLRPPDDPREALDYSCQRQLEILQKVRRGVADVATSRKRVELQVSQLAETAAKLASSPASLNAWIGSGASPRPVPTGSSLHGAGIGSSVTPPASPTATTKASGRPLKSASRSTSAAAGRA